MQRQQLHSVIETSVTRDSSGTELCKWEIFWNVCALPCICLCRHLKERILKASDVMKLTQGA